MDQSVKTICSPLPVCIQEDKEHGWNTGWIDAFHTITSLLNPVNTLPFKIHIFKPWLNIEQKTMMRLWKGKAPLYTCMVSHWINLT